VTQFRGLTWDHPRGYLALERAAHEAGGLITWDRQPLEGFESAPIDAVCKGYDLVVLDHPHLGDALAADCLQPIDALLGVDVIADIRARTLKPCFDSYMMQGALWALPLDGAAQVSAGRPDLMSLAMPETYGDLDHMSGSTPGFALSLAGPHAFLTLLSLCAGLDDRFGPIEDGYFQPRHDPAIELFITLARRSDAKALNHNPIALLEGLATGYLTYCPLIFGYATYAHTSNRHPVTFANAPCANRASPPRAVLGGTGIAVTQNCAPTPALTLHLADLMSVQMQTGLFPANQGQPTSQAAWHSSAINAPLHGFYQNTIETLHNAFLRPRHVSFVASQTRAANWLREALLDRPAKPVAIRQHLNSVLRDVSLQESTSTRNT